MWKEIPARAYAYGACDKPACKKDSRFAPARSEKRDQAECGKRPHDRLSPRKDCQRAPAIFKPLRCSHRADVIQVVGEDVVDKLGQSAAPPEIEDHQPYYS